MLQVYVTVSVLSLVVHVYYIITFYLLNFTLYCRVITQSTLLFKTFDCLKSVYYSR